ncbi:MAG: ADP-glyceromanno-heptose 6-epimerase [Thermoflavifilum sp.]|nr:ADP-glyceromanno-heptose 6-epimerase [Thermoflavifilum sp.]
MNTYSLTSDQVAHIGNHDDLILVTGAAGFIGSCLVGFLNQQGYENLILSDDFSRPDKLKNLENKRYLQRIPREQLFDWLSQRENTSRIRYIFHIGARTDTTEFNREIFNQLNVQYSQRLWEYAVAQQIPFLYASSAATYGDGSMGYADDHARIADLRPLNPYGWSKQQFDLWALSQPIAPPHWYGLKFFNVYGPNEYHKGRMASVVWHAYRQIQETGIVRLFQSHRPEYRDGEQLRDFIYVKDIVKICYWFMQYLPASGIYNAGTGKARTFNDLVKATFEALNKPVQIQYIPIPEDIRNTYQYFTEAQMHKLRHAGYNSDFCSLEEGIADYVQQYLLSSKYY